MESVWTQAGEVHEEPSAQRKIQAVTTANMPRPQNNK